MNQHERIVGLLPLGRGVGGGWGCAGHPAHISLQKEGKRRKRLFVALMAIVTIPLIGTSASANVIADIYGDSGYGDKAGSCGAVGAVTVATWFGDRFGSAIEESVRASHPDFEPNEPPVGAQITSVGFSYRLWKSSNHKDVTYSATVYASGTDLATTIAGPSLGSIQWTQNTGDQAWYTKWIPLTSPVTWNDYNLNASDPSTQGYWWVIRCVANNAGEFHTRFLNTGVWGNRGYQSTSAKDWRNETFVDYVPEPATIGLIGASLLLVLRRRSRQ